MRSSLFNRRQLLKLTGVGIGGATVGASSASAALTDLEITYSGGGWGATSTADDNIMTNVNIEVEFSDEITFGPDEDLGLRITNVDTGDQLSCAATEMFTVQSDDRIELSNLHNRDGTIPDDPEFQLNTDDIEFYSAEVEGDNGTLTDGPVFSTYTVEVIENLDDPSVIATTEEATRAIGLERPPIEQDSFSGEFDLSLELPEALDSSWFVEFSPFIPDDGFAFGAVEIPNLGTDTLEWTADFSGSEPGSYDGWQVAVYPDDEFGTNPIWSTTGYFAIDDDFIQVDETDAPTEPKVQDWHDLNDIRENLNGDYELMADLNSDTGGYEEHVNNPDGGWSPIGDENDGFTGTFDGNGHKIVGLQIDRPDQDRIGLFGEVDRGFITDLTLTEVNISGNEYVGGLTGFNDGTSDENGIIDNVDISGSVSGTEQVGGLVGRNHTAAEITDSTASCDITADGNSIGGLVGAHNGDLISNSVATGSIKGEFNTGGFVGVNFDKIENCYSTGDVEGDTTGGFAGGNDSGAEITRSYATGDVTSNGRAGGFVEGNSGGTIVESFATGTVNGDETVGGFVSGNGNEFSEEDGVRAEINDCYALGKVTGDKQVGGFVGYNFFGDVEQSYAAGDVSGNENVGGFVGINRNESTVNDAYWDTTAADTSDGATEVEATEMQGESAIETMPMLDFDEAWNIVVDPDGYPMLAWQDGPVEQPEDEEIEGDVTITLNNNGSLAWQVTDINGADNIAEEETDNPTLTIEPGTRYVIENNGWDDHPLAFRDEAGEALLTQAGDGTFEDNTAVEWVDEGDKLAFTLTEILSTEMNSYVCTVHTNAMAGDLSSPVDLRNITLDNNTIASDGSTHLLSFDVFNLSPDDDPDKFTIQMPKNVDIDSINDIEASNIDIIEEPDASKPLKFEVNPASPIENPVTITVNLTLSSDSE